MMSQQTFLPDMYEVRHRFLDRRKLYANRDQITALANQVRGLLEAGNTTELRKLIDQYYPPDFADVMELLNDEQDLALFNQLEIAEAADVLDELDACTKEKLVRAAPPERLARMIETLPADEGADIASYLTPQGIKDVTGFLKPVESEDIRLLLSFPKQSAGRIMSLGFTAVPITATSAEAMQAFKETPDVESIFSIYVVDENGALQGVMGLRQLLSSAPSRPVRDYMTRAYACTHPETDQEEVARIFARYDLNSLPVVTQDGKLIGVVTADDMIDVIEQENTEDLLRMAGSDAAEMERAKPSRIAVLRLPWIMATMFIELMAGFVIHYYDGTIAKVLLLASFMPIISAISGNTGLQSATIIVRGISAGTIRVTDMVHAVARQLIMTAILGAATGLTLGIIGSIWYGKWSFGLVIFLGMFTAVNIAGVVGTVVPLTSKRLGFDPAITSGPFETAFQDVVGISIFLTLATLMLPYLVK